VVGGEIRDEEVSMSSTWPERSATEDHTTDPAETNRVDTHRDDSHRDVSHRDDTHRDDTHRDDTYRNDTDRTAPMRPFGVTPVSQTEWDQPEEERPAKARHVVDRFDGALALLILRLVVAGIFGIHGLQKLQYLDTTRASFVQNGVPYADTMAFVVGVCEVAIAVALIFGIAVRVVGVCITLLMVGALVYVVWRSGSIFIQGREGFAGQLELLLAAVGLTFAGLGGGGWTVDRRFRRR
jgi:putative oxidoreductase